MQGILISVFCVILLGCGQIESKTNETRAQGRVLSLFSVVQFKNSVCQSTSSSLNGTCFTSSECSNKGGSANGNCASGFGVCCVFTITSTSGTVSQNNSYLQNPGYPSVYTSTSGVSYTINKVSSDVCSLRLDFDRFVLLGPQLGTATVATEISPICVDTFKVTVSTGQTIPQICGINTGQHMYIDIGEGSSDTATIALTFSSTITSTTRQWNIRVSQIPCASETSPPNGCLQYHYAQSGRITTFNFDDTTGGHLDNQQYSICIRRELGYCCIQYEVCPDQTNAFSLGGGAGAATAMVDIACLTFDYIEIDASSSLCTTQGTNLASRYCGNYLSPDGTLADNVPICDCTTPFEVAVYTDAIPDGGAGVANTAFSRGVCLDYEQQPC